MDQLEVLDPVRDGHGGELFDDVESPTHRRVADGVNRRRDAPPGGRREALPGLALAREHDAPVLRAFVGLEHPGRLAPQRPIQKELHATRHEPAGPPARAEPHPERGVQAIGGKVSQHPQPQCVLALQTLKRRQRFGTLDVLDPGHAEPMRRALRFTDRLEHLIRRRAGEMPVHESHGVLQEQAGGLAGGIPDDAPPPALGVGGVPVDAADGQGTRVHPEGMDVVGIESGGRVGKNSIERLPGGRPLPPIGVVPLAKHPTIRGSGTRDSRHRLNARLAPRQVHPAAPQGPLGKVGVPVDEPGRDQTAGELHHLGSGPEGGRLVADVGE